jgi:hypothetical protein
MSLGICLWENVVWANVVSPSRMEVVKKTTYLIKKEIRFPPYFFLLLKQPFYYSFSHPSTRTRDKTAVLTLEKNGENLLYLLNK